MARQHPFSLAAPYQARPNIRVVPPRNPYRILTTSSAYPATFGTPATGNYLVIREEEEDSSSWPS